MSFQKEMQAAPKDFELKHQSEESKKKDSKNQQTKDFLKGKKEKFAEVSQNKRTRLKKPMEKKEKQKKKTKAKSEPSVSFFLLNFTFTLFLWVLPYGFAFIVFESQRLQQCILFKYINIPFYSS